MAAPSPLLGCLGVLARDRSLRTPQPARATQGLRPSQEGGPRTSVRSTLLALHRAEFQRRDHPATQLRALLRLQPAMQVVLPRLEAPRRDDEDRAVSPGPGGDPRRDAVPRPDDKHAPLWRRAPAPEVRRVPDGPLRGEAPAEGDLPAGAGSHERHAPEG